MRNLARTWLGVFAFLFGFALAAGAQISTSANVDQALLADGWNEVTFDKKTPNRFQALESGGVTVISEQSVSLLEKPISVDLERTPVLTWRWQVGQAAPPTDLDIKGEDDRSIALYITFPFVPEEASVMERMRRAVVERVAGQEAPGRVLMYVWGGKGERGEQVPSPHLGEAGVMTILRPAGSETKRWDSERVDIAEDYRKSFGTEPPDPMSIAIGADTDDTSSVATGFVTDLDFVPRASQDEGSG